MSKLGTRVQVTVNSADCVCSLLASRRTTGGKQSLPMPTDRTPEGISKTMDDKKLY